MFICSRVSIGRICTRVRLLLSRFNLHPLVVDQNAFTIIFDNLSAFIMLFIMARNVAEITTMER